MTSHKTEAEIRRSYEDHLRLVEALKNQNVAACRTLMREHLHYTQGLFERKGKAQ